MDWNAAKNEILKSERGVSFEAVVATLIEDGFLDIVKHPNEKKYAHQKMFVVNVDNYVYLVPFVEDDEKIFLKTIIPSRDATKHYLIQKAKK